MNIFKKALFVLLILNLSSIQTKAVPDSFADLAEKLIPSVVNISTTQTVRTTTNKFPFQFEKQPKSSDEKSQQNRFFTEVLDMILTGGFYE